MDNPHTSNIKKVECHPLLHTKKTKKKERSFDFGWFDFHKIKTFTVQSKSLFALGSTEG